jgi:spermidine/putrescine-binding protein
VAALALAVLAAPLAAAGGVPAGERVLNVYIWSNYIAPETLRRFEELHDVKVNVDLYDSNEALLAKMQAGNADYDVVCPSNYVVETLRQTGGLLELDHSALPSLHHLAPRFVDQPHDPGNRYSVPYFWGTAGIAYRRSKTGPVDSWDALWDPRFAGRILMLDDPRETLGTALRRVGHTYNETDPARLREAQRMLAQQRPLVRAYDSASFDSALLSGDVWLAQAWSGQIARAMDEDPDIAWVIPKEGASLFLDSLAIPRTAPHPELAHAFLEYVLQPEIAAEITRTMRYSTPNASALPLLPDELRRNPAMFPTAEDLARTELINDVGEATVLYERLWTEVKSGG